MERHSALEAYGKEEATAGTNAGTVHRLLHESGQGFRDAHAP